MKKVYLYNTKKPSFREKHTVLPKRAHRDGQDPKFYYTDLNPSRNQEQCGSCWAFATAQCLEDHARIKFKKKNVRFSVEHLLACICSKPSFTCKDYEYCQGGSPQDALVYLKETNDDYIVTERLSQYFVPTVGSQLTCSSYSELVKSEGDIADEHKFKLADFSVIDENNLADQIISMKDALKSGPLIGYMWVHEEGGQTILPPSYNDPSGSIYGAADAGCGGHAIEIVGYNHPNHELDISDSRCFEGAYWLIKNSWGSGYEQPQGESDLNYGTFRLQMGLGSGDSWNPNICDPKQLVETLAYSVTLHHDVPQTPARRPKQARNESREQKPQEYEAGTKKKTTDSSIDKEAGKSTDNKDESSKMSLFTKIGIVVLVLLLLLILFFLARRSSKAKRRGR